MGKVEGWLTDELMQRARKLIQDIDGIASQGSIYVVSRALYEAEKRGREGERERIASEVECDCCDVCGESPGYPKCANEIAAAIRSGQ